MAVLRTATIALQLMQRMQPRQLQRQNPVVGIVGSAQLMQPWLLPLPSPRQPARLSLCAQMPSLRQLQLWGCRSPLRLRLGPAQPRPHAHAHAHARSSGREHRRSHSPLPQLRLHCGAGLRTLRQVLPPLTAAHLFWRPKLLRTHQAAARRMRRLLPRLWQPQGLQQRAPRLMQLLQPPHLQQPRLAKRWKTARLSKTALAALRRSSLPCAMLGTASQPLQLQLQVRPQVQLQARQAALRLQLLPPVLQLHSRLTRQAQLTCARVRR